MTADLPRIYLDANVLLSYVNDAPKLADVVQSLLEDAEDGKVHLLTSNLSIVTGSVSIEAASGGISAHRRALRAPEPMPLPGQ